MIEMLQEKFFFFFFSFDTSRTTMNHNCLNLFPFVSLACGRRMVNQENRYTGIHYHPQWALKNPCLSCYYETGMERRKKKTPVAEISQACNLILSAHKQSLIR